MPANTLPIFTLTPKIGNAQVSAANANRDGTGTIVTVLTGGTNGTRVHRITIQAAVTTTAGMVRLFIGDDAGSPVIRLWREIPVSAITVSATVGGFNYQLELFGERALILPPNYTLRASTEKADAISVVAEGADF